MPVVKTIASEKAPRERQQPPWATRNQPEKSASGDFSRHSKGHAYPLSPEAQQSCRELLPTPTKTVSDVYVGQNLYAFVENDGVNRVDYLGLDLLSTLASTFANYESGPVWGAESKSLSFFKMVQLIPTYLSFKVNPEAEIDQLPVGAGGYTRVFPRDWEIEIDKEQAYCPTDCVILRIKSATGRGEMGWHKNSTARVKRHEFIHAKDYFNEMVRWVSRARKIAIRFGCVEDEKADELIGLIQGDLKMAHYFRVKANTERRHNDPRLPNAGSMLRSSQAAIDQSRVDEALFRRQHNHFEQDVKDFLRDFQ